MKKNKLDFEQCSNVPLSEDYTKNPNVKVIIADPLKPSAGLLCKLGSIAVHAQELLSSTGHAFDRDALQTLYNDGEVKAWLAKMGALAFLPVKR